MRVFALITCSVVFLMGLTPLYSHAGIGNAKANFYPGSSVKVLFENGDMADQGLVIALANEWTHYANINFEFYFASQHTLSELSSIEYAANIIVRFADSTDEWRNEGEKAFYNQYRYYGERMLFTQRKHGILITQPTPRVILHEFGHALGLQHEHQHPAAPYSQTLINNICATLKWDEQECAFNMTPFSKDESFIFTDYDANSIMHYDFFGDFTEQAYLSIGDAELIAKLYPGVIAPEQIAPQVKQRSTLFLNTLQRATASNDNNITSRKGDKHKQIFNVWFNNAQDEPLLHFSHALDNNVTTPFTYTNYTLDPVEVVKYVNVPGVSAPLLVAQNAPTNVTRLGPFRQLWALAQSTQQPVDNSLDNVFIWRVQSKHEKDLHTLQLDANYRLHGAHIINTKRTDRDRGQLHVLHAKYGTLIGELKLREGYQRGLLINPETDTVSVYEIDNDKCVTFQYPCSAEACMEDNQQPANIDSPYALISKVPTNMPLPFDEVTYSRIDGKRVSSIEHLYRPHAECDAIRRKLLQPVISEVAFSLSQQPLSDALTTTLLPAQ